MASPPPAAAAAADILVITAHPQMEHSRVNRRLMHGAHRIEEAEVAAHETMFAQRLASYPDWPELEHLADCIACEVPDDARPTELPDAAPHATLRHNETAAA